MEGDNLQSPFNSPNTAAAPFFDAFGNCKSLWRIGLLNLIGTSENVSTPPAITISA